MELDDLKEKWRATPDQSSTVEIRDAIEKKISALRRSGRGIRRVFMIEIMIVLVIYSGVLLMMWFMGERFMSYMYKIVIVTTIGSLPVVWRLYKAQKWINTMDYAKDIRTNMIAFLAYYKTTLRMYQWSTYVVVVILLVLMFTDADFMQLPLKLKLLIVGYMSTALLLTAPYIRLTYGRQTASFEDFLRD